MSDEFIEYLLEQLQQVEGVRTRRMFGGYGIYKDDLMFGLVADETLYLKVDEHNRADFEAQNLPCFLYEKNAKVVKMSYYQAPESALDDPEEMAGWARKSYQAALRAKAKKAK